MTSNPEVLELEAPPAARWITGRLEEAGFETWAVGGAVRDEIRGVHTVDWDFATRARPSEVRRVFKRTVPVGIAHGTVGVIDRDGVLHEVTTFRKDVETDGRHAVVSFADHIEDDLSRRDFTINALAWHPLRSELLDPFGGRSDLAAGILRTVGVARDRFAEDHLRILRALRFAGRFGLRIERDTWTAACASVAHLGGLSSERIREELVKVLAAPEPPSTALRLYRECGALSVLYPELAALDDAAWRDTLDVVDAAPHDDPWLRMAALLGRVGEPAASARDPDPDAVAGLKAADPVARRGVVRAAALLSRLKVSNAQLAAVTGWMSQGPVPPVDPDGPERRRWLAAAGADRLGGYAVLWRARRRARPDEAPDPESTIAALERELAAGTP
ncbi:MAG: CCA tRNA nucleotidyltransferase, partial [Gemmatimonadetes bacterium]|nr:CCA tRNA nucleotidyltransferase [Gemmatimonadota bacterium]